MPSLPTTPSVALPSTPHPYLPHAPSCVAPVSRAHQYANSSTRRGYSSASAATDAVLSVVGIEYTTWRTCTSLAIRGMQCFLTAHCFFFSLYVAYLLSAAYHVSTSSHMRPLNRHIRPRSLSPPPSARSPCISPPNLENGSASRNKCSSPAYDTLSFPLHPLFFLFSFLPQWNLLFPFLPSARVTPRAFDRSQRSFVRPSALEHFRCPSRAPAVRLFIPSESYSPLYSPSLCPLRDPPSSQHHRSCPWAAVRHVAPSKVPVITRSISTNVIPCSPGRRSSSHICVFLDHRPTERGAMRESFVHMHKICVNICNLLRVGCSPMYTADNNSSCTASSV